MIFKILLPNNHKVPRLPFPFKMKLFSVNACTQLFPSLSIVVKSLLLKIRRNQLVNISNVSLIQKKIDSLLLLNFLDRCGHVTVPNTRCSSAVCTNIPDSCKHSSFIFKFIEQFTGKWLNVLTTFLFIICMLLVTSSCIWASC